MANEERDKGGFGNLSSIFAVLMLVAGAIWVNLSLEGRRPTAAPSGFSPTGAQDVDARLWQDPFGVVAKAREKRKESRQKKPAPLDVTLALRDGRVRVVPKAVNGDADPEHPPSVLARQIKDKIKDGSEVIVISVMVFGNATVGADEYRRRTRYAVLSALLQESFSPVDPERIGYSDTQALGPGHPHFVPYEWLRDNWNRKRELLVLWVDEGSFGQPLAENIPKEERGPLARLSRLVALLVEEAPRERLRLDFIGPAGTDLLMEMADEMVALRARPLGDKLVKAVGAMGFFSPFATIADGVLTQKLLAIPGDPGIDECAAGIRLAPAPAPVTMSEAESDPESEPEAHTAPVPATPAQPRRCDTADLFRVERDRDTQAIKRAGLRIFLRTTASDSDTVRALLTELRKRKIGPEVPIAIIGEEDTEYARQLRDEIALAHRRDAPLSPAARGVVGVATLPMVHSFGYLRGIDGKAGEEKTGEPKTSGDKNREQTEVERPEGDSQVDYLRRLAELMRQRERSLERHAQEGWKWWFHGRMRFGAIGIVGNDYYDKLLVLQALRPMFPEAVFFTTDLYAAMLHPADNRVTRNLIVGSGFGLTVHPALQGDTPPFRDSYQTATFMAVKVSLATSGRGGESIPGDVVQRWQSPTLTEVGRTRFYDLTAEKGECHPDPLYCAQTADFSRRLADLRWWEISLLTAGSLMLLVGMSATARGLLWHWLRPRRDVQHMGWRYARWMPAGLLVILAATLGYFLYVSLTDANTAGGEPFAWFEGVSVWPSSLVRLAALLFAASSFVYVLRRMHTRMARTEGKFFPAGLDFEARAGLADPSALWRRYRASMQGWKAALTGLAKLAVVGIFFASLTPLVSWPAVPARSEWAFGANGGLVIMAAAAAMLLLICVATAIRHTGNLARGLGRKLWWPDKLRREHGLPDSSQPEQFDDWLGLQVIARQSEAVNNLIYLPFFALLLLAVARNRMFDNWSMPPHLLLVLGFGFLYLFVSAVSLRLSAERARKRALATLRGTLIRLQGVAQDDAPPAKHLVDQCKTLIEQTEKLDRGAFSPFTQQPLVRGILALAGGISGAALFEYASAANF
jgi:hypothetical protein